MLVAVKLLHTLVWCGMALCIVAIPVFGAWRLWWMAAGATAIVLAECAVLWANGWRCPMTGWAARYTKDRRDNFDIYLPLWLARQNKTIFGILFIFNLLVLVFEWFSTAA